MGIIVPFHGRVDQPEQLLTFNQGTAASVTNVPMGIADFAGVITTVRLAAVTPLTGNATYTAQINKNGTGILSAAAGLTTGTAARASVLGTLTASPTPFSPGDFFDVTTVNTPGTGSAPANICVEVGLVPELAGARRIPIGIATTEGVISDARISCLTPLTGNDTYTIDFQRTPAGGSPASILAGGTPISLTTTSAARQSIAGSIAQPATVLPGDYFEAVITPTHGTGTLPLGVFYQLFIIQNI